MISVITPCYKQARYLFNNVQSVADQLVDLELEHIIVDDGNEDDSVDEEFERHHWDWSHHIKLVQHKKNLGLAAARNTAIRASVGEFIVPLDADDMLTPGSLKIRMDMFKERPGLHVVHGYALKIREICYYEARKAMEEGKLVRHPSRLHSQGMMYKREIFEKYGLYYDVYSKEDKALNYRLGIHDKSPLPKIVGIKRVKADVAFYRRHPESMHKKRVADKKFDKKICKKFDDHIKRLQKYGIKKEIKEWL